MQLWSNFDTQKPTFVRNFMELLLTTNMFLSTSILLLSTLFSSIVQDLLVAIISQKSKYSHHISVATLLREVFYFIELMPKKYLD